MNIKEMVALAEENFVEFKKEVKNLNKKELNELQEVIIATKNSWKIYEFARDVKGADILKLQDEIIKLGDAEYIYLYKSIKGSDINTLKDAILKTNNAEYIYGFARSYEGDKTAFCYAIGKAGVAEYITEFIRNIHLFTGDLYKIQDGVIDTNNAELISWFAENVKGADKKNLMCIAREIKENQEQGTTV